MTDLLTSLQETRSHETSGHETSRLDAEPAPAPRKGERLGRQAQLPVAPGFEEISPLIAPLSRATAFAGDTPLRLIDPSEDDGDSVAAFWAY